MHRGRGVCGRGSLSSRVWPSDMILYELQFRTRALLFFQSVFVPVWKHDGNTITKKKKKA